ncbi:MAG: YitT family protein [Clostridium sp.]|uniref:YitT family protein n=1 Tax=Clostridium sp. TaxID=1506 RepID=UPI002A88EC4D|nr:YitT family protein [Clostridium sp.]MDY5098885.1 YitT family protein [Clostridium sp.]
MKKQKKSHGFYMQILIILLGSFITAISINAFIIPHKLLSGGASGLALILQYTTKISSGYWVMIINIPIFIAGYILLDRKFILRSFIGMMALSTFLVLTKNVATYVAVDDILLSTVFGAVLGGIGTGLIFKDGSSQGGGDIVAIIIRKKKGIKIPTICLTIDIIVVILGTLVTNLSIGMYTMILMYIKSKVVEKVINIFDKKHILMIVTKKEDEMAKAILNKLGRGVTFLYGEGAYTHEKKRMLYCIVNERELNEMKNMIENIDEGALISIYETYDVQGNGFLKAAL